MKEHSEHLGNWRARKKSLTALTALKLGLQAKIPNQNTNEASNNAENVMPQIQELLVAQLRVLLCLSAIWANNRHKS